MQDTSNEKEYYVAPKQSFDKKQSLIIFGVLLFVLCLGFLLYWIRSTKTFSPPQQELFISEQATIPTSPTPTIIPALK